MPLTPGRPRGARSVWRFSLADVAAAVGLTRRGLRAALRRQGLRFADGAEGLRVAVELLAPRLGWVRRAEKRP